MGNIKERNSMTKNLYKLLYLIITSLSMTIIGMEGEKQIPWDKLPTELRSLILKEVAEGENIEQILESLKNATRVNKEFRGLAKSLVHNPEDVSNIARMYIEKNPKVAYEEFFKAIEEGKADIVKALLGGGIDVNSGDEYDTPLMKAIEAKNLNMMQMLINAGASVNAKSSYGNTAIKRAVYSNNREALQILLDANVDVDAQDRDGHTPLMLAAISQNKEIIKRLLSKGADPNIQNVIGVKALMLAQYANENENKKEIIELLEKAINERS